MKGSSHSKKKASGDEKEWGWSHLGQLNLSSTKKHIIKADQS